jgi:3-methyl-2-oxobutanoate hydroxymethyltransferase
MKSKMTMKDLREAKGKRKLVMTNAADYNTARAAEQAGIDIITGRGLFDERQMCFGLDQIRQGAPNTLLACNLPPTVAYVSDSEAIRCAMVARDHGADLIYSSGNSLSRLRAMAELRIPVAGHVGLVPIHSSWLGGLRAVGKTVEEALRLYRETMALQEIGAVVVELECVPAEIAAHITRQTTLVTLSLGSGPDCDGQFLFSSDVLGILDGQYPGLSRTYAGPLPRHAKRYAHLHEAAIRAFEAFVNDVQTSEFPAPTNVIHVGEAIVEEFLTAIKATTS